MAAQHTGGGVRLNTLRLYQADVLGIGKLCFHDWGIGNTGEARLGLLKISMILDLSLKNRHLEILSHAFISYIMVTLRCYLTEHKSRYHFLPYS